LDYNQKSYEIDLYFPKLFKVYGLNLLLSCGLSLYSYLNFATDERPNYLSFLHDEALEAFEQSFI